MQRPSFLAATVLAALSLEFLTPAESYAQAHTKGTPVVPFTATLKPGNYVWHPEVSPAGPVVVSRQFAGPNSVCDRYGVGIGRSTLSTGKPGKRTPNGVFTVLQKKVRHTSSIYKGAQMPHMQRLTWSGIAFHAGYLPGYAASAGCVRMPVDFAAKLYSVPGIGATVIIADHKSPPNHTIRPG